MRFLLQPPSLVLEETCGEPRAAGSGPAAGSVKNVSHFLCGGHIVKQRFAVSFLLRLAVAYSDTV